MVYCYIDEGHGLQRVPFEDEGVTGKELPFSTQSSPLAMEVNGQLWDLHRIVPAEAVVRPIMRDMPEGIEILRHSTAHILAQAVKELYPETQITIGPVIEEGFYYDFFRTQPFHEEDLPRIQQRMKEIVDRDEPVNREVWSREEAITFFTQQGEMFKADIIRDLPEDEVITVYHQGHFTDLCRGPHVPSTGVIGKGFCLTKISGAYWRGNPQNPQLQRIYGTAWPTEAELQHYLSMREEAEKRDHRKLAKAMDLFHFQEEAPGSVFWHPAGWTLYRLLQDYIRACLRAQDYQEVNTPQLISSKLWQASGHWDKFRDNMFSLHHHEVTYGLKPMNCPCHVQIFNQGIKSYRDLPLRMAEFGSCMRDEPSGARAGLMRVCSFTQDDAHIFCTPEQMIDETTQFCRLLFQVYETLGFGDIIVRFSSRPEKRLGSDVLWDRAEAALREGADRAGLSYTHFPGEGAFYGPKLEFVLKDALGRLWQCGTLQMDFVLPERLGAFYTDVDGQKRHPVMLHRAILGSLERFIGVLLEHYGGHLPLWLAPVQGVIATISEKAASYGQQITDKFKAAGLRVELDDRPEKIGYKVREHTTRKVPCILVIGAQEAAAQSVALRYGEVNRTLGVDEAITLFQKADQQKWTQLSGLLDIT